MSMDVTIAAGVVELIDIAQLCHNTIQNSVCHSPNTLTTSKAETSHDSLKSKRNDMSLLRFFCSRGAMSLIRAYVSER